MIFNKNERFENAKPYRITSKIENSDDLDRINELDFHSNGILKEQF